MKKFAIVFLGLLTALPALAQTKTVTNADLEKFRQKRVESERQLKENYAALGFPSPEELEKQRAARRAAMEEYSDELRYRRELTQNEIVEQANQLRLQIASVESQINYLRGVQGGSVYKGGTLSAPFAFSYGYAPGGYNRGGRSPLRQISRLPQNMRTVQEYAAMYPSSQSIYNQATGNVRIGGRTGGVRVNIGGYGGRLNYGNRGYYRGGYIAPVIVLGADNENPYADQIVYLEQQRAGLRAQWNILAEQARRAGIRID